MKLPYYMQVKFSWWGGEAERLLGHFPEQHHRTQWCCILLPLLAPQLFKTFPATLPLWQPPSTAWNPRGAGEMLSSRPDLENTVLDGSIWTHKNFWRRGWKGLRVWTMFLVGALQQTCRSFSRLASNSSYWKVLQIPFHVLHREGWLKTRPSWSTSGGAHLRATGASSNSPSYTKNEKVLSF